MAGFGEGILKNICWWQSTTPTLRPGKLLQPMRAKRSTGHCYFSPLVCCGLVGGNKTPLIRLERGAQKTHYFPSSRSLQRNRGIVIYIVNVHHHLIRHIRIHSQIRIIFTSWGIAVRVFSSLSYWRRANCDLPILWKVRALCFTRRSHKA